MIDGLLYLLIVIACLLGYWSGYYQGKMDEINKAIRHSGNRKNTPLLHL